MRIFFVSRGKHDVIHISSAEGRYDGNGSYIATKPLKVIRFENFEYNTTNKDEILTLLNHSSFKDGRISPISFNATDGFKRLTLRTAQMNILNKMKETAVNGGNINMKLLDEFIAAGEKADSKVA